MHASLLSLPALLLTLPVVLAGFSQGTVNLTRDYAIEYTGYANTAAFCTEFRNQCVTYNGRRNHHHQVDCVFTQPGPVVRAFCGGLPRDIFGNLPPKGSPVDAYTVPVVALVHGAKIVGPPVVGSASTTVPPKSQSSKAPLSVSTVSKAPASVSTLPSHSTLSKSHHHKSHTASRSALSANPTPTHHKVHPHKPHHPKSIHKAHKRLVYSHFGLCHKWKKQCEEKGSASKSVHSYCETHLLDFLVTRVSCSSPDQDLTKEVIKALYLKEV